MSLKPSATMLGILCSLMVLSLSVHHDASAEGDDPKSFFNRGFVSEPRGAEIDSSAKQRAPRTPKAKPTKRNPRAGMGAIVSAETDQSGKTSKEIFETEVTGDKIKRVGAILDGSDREHFYEHINALIEVVRHGDLPAGRVYLLSDLRTLDVRALAGLQSHLMSLGGMLVPTQNLPSRYEKVERSPTWLIEIDKGEVILEAPSSLRAHLNAGTHFVEQPQAVSAQVDGILESQPDELIRIEDESDVPDLPALERQ